MPASILQDALGDAPQTNPSRDVEQDDRVGTLDSLRQRAAEVAIKDPLGLRDQLIDRARPLILRRLLPARLPVDLIEMSHRQVENRAELRRECRFAGPTRADNENALHWR